jgi:uncharacterized protein YjiS (DUF1127 family)
MIIDTAAVTQARRPADGWLRALIARLSHCRQIQREREQLLALTDRELRDIGISRADAIHEARKPLWRD